MRLIDADALKAEIVDWKVNLHPKDTDYATGYFSALSVVEGMLAYAPTIDPESLRPKGEWEIITDEYDNEMMRCTRCRSEFYDGENDTVDTLHNFCPHCGADMRGTT